MKKMSCYSGVIFLCFFLLSATPGRAQLIIGQYEDEAPFRTWNTFGIATATAVGMGETHLASVADASASVINPARLTALPRFSCSLTGSFTRASFHKYGVVNTGVLITEGNSSVGIYGLDFAGATFTIRGWAVGISIGLLENYERPPQSPHYRPGGQLLYLFQFQQSGHLRNYNLSLARELGKWISLGLAVNYVEGKMEKSVTENMYLTEITISDSKKHDFTGFYVNGGLSAEVSDKLTIGAVFRTPYTKEAESQSKLRFDSPQGNTDIRIDAEAKNAYKMPWVMGIGIDYKFSRRLRVASDLSYFRWSSYSVDYFGENIQRDFKDILKIAGGLEYIGSLQLFQQECQLPLRAGLTYDPQPVKKPNMYYMYYTLGFGLYWQHLRLDAGAMFGFEKGSGHDLYGHKIVMTVSYFL